MDHQPFVFISYAHANSDIILPVLKTMRSHNISLWYDEGIVAGSEWPEFIAEKVVECEKFILFVSKAYLDSQNCTRELNFAISRKKKILSIFLEDVQLSPGMEMQLGTYQAIYRTRFATTQDFVASLCKEPFFDDCKVAPEAPAPELRQPTPEQPKPQPSVPQTPVTQTPTRQHTPVTSYTPPVSTHPDPAMPHSDYTPETVYDTDNIGYSSATVSAPLNRMLAVILAFLLGGLGIQHFYMRNKVAGIISLLFCWTYVPIFIGIIHAVLLFRMSDEEFQDKCGKG